ncbi:MAG: hypothetical protein GF400_04820 [Candidatus Eisenbacteria bacterium]|nr:hypothetical protein [Candidatus Eisenbacteria bacterium]
MKRLLAVMAVVLAVLPASLSSAQDCVEEVTFETWPGTLFMRHHEALFNCCAWLDVEVVTTRGTIEFTEWEMFEQGPCYCLCCFDAEATVGGLDPGEYTARVWKAMDNFDGTWTFELAAEEVVTIEGESEPSLETSYTPCVGSSAPGQPNEATWGTIKALYR